MVKIAPSILAADFTRLEQQVLAVERAGADMIHCDVMDGHFVPNISFGPMVVAAVRRISALPIDTHLMISNPERYVDDFQKAGTDTLIVHVEVTHHLHRLIYQIRDTGMQVGVAVNPATPITALEEILPDIDQILLMTVNPGFGGQRFISTTVDKIYRLKMHCEARGFSPAIAVDGGIDQKTATMVVKAGADILIAGSSIFSTPDPGAAVHSLRTLVDNPSQ